MMLPDGIYTVLVTPFTVDNQIDYISITKWLIEQEKQKGISGLVLMGTTSESPTLSNEEKINIIKYISKQNKTAVYPKKIIAGVGGNWTENVIEFTTQILDYVDGIMVTVPHYNKPPQRGIVSHFQRVGNHFPSTPIIMYNVPGRAGVNMTPESMIEVIKSCPNVIGLKETNLKNAPELYALLKKEGFESGRFKLFAGDDANIIEYSLLGATGLISVASNIIPKQMCDVMSLCNEQRYDFAKSYLSNHKEFLDQLFIESNPIPIKDIMFRTGLYTTNLMRLPLVPFDSNESETLWDLYNKLS